MHASFSESPTDDSFGFNDDDLHLLMEDADREHGLPDADSAALFSEPADRLVSTQQSLSELESAQTDTEQTDSKLTRQEVQDLEDVRRQVDQPPFQRFRSKYKHLSVSDLVAPAWCELQFQYALEKSGRKRRTPAMKQGTKMHTALEELVHQIVPFEVSDSIQEEKLGLQLLKLYTGLLELEKGGLTRELPVFGMVDGILVRGVIDEVAYTDTAPPASQERALMDGFFAVQSASTRHIVLSDAKTRVSMRSPSTSQVAQAKLQLMLYRTLLQNLVSFDLSRLLERDKLDGEQPFSDAFLAQSIGILESFSDEAIASAAQSQTLTGLWQLLQPMLAQVRQRLSQDLIINYIHQRTHQEIARITFTADDAWQAEQMRQILGWWRGEHAPRGVEVEEAFKCRICDFEEGCSWKLDKIEESVRRKRDRAVKQAA